MSSSRTVGGSGFSAVKSLSTTLEKALVGSGKLSSVHGVHSLPSYHPQYVHMQQHHHDDDVAQRISPRKEDESDYNSAESRGVSDNSDPFVALANSFTADDGNVDAHLLELVDPLSILLRTWLQCCDDSSQVTKFVSCMKRCVGCSEEDAIQTALRVDMMVSEFQRKGTTFAWNLVDGVGPLEENAIVTAVVETLGESGVWADKISAVWRCALVHLDK
ncbi:GPI-anchored surface protein, putative [Bodo saltans]|uniref:GPI-anchored surface protein, putative n=1 Tax=Bodo saltans TaxID=75058 RepID=A0A0S4JMD8_BODSA|nr:GPI-anchored surface protein, putative [Bodo saltans]|eukprot:CUG90274.1 GPI-anchored surface protein, putative [Bodo saltans]